MIEQIIYFAPLAILFFGIGLFLTEKPSDYESYHCFHLARILLILSLIIDMIFFNKPLLPQITIGNHFTLLNTCFMYLGAFVLIFFSRKWFMSMKIPANYFCVYIFIATIAGNLLITSVNLLLTVLCLIIFLILNIFILRSFQTKKISGDKIYTWAAVTVIFSLILACLKLVHFDNFLSYDSLRYILENNNSNGLLFTSVAVILIAFIFIIGLVPLHFWFTEIVSLTVLPTFSYFILMPVVACFAGLINFNVYALAPILNKLQFFYMSIAVISVCFGAVGACSSQNVRKIFAYGAVYHQAIVFLILQRFSLNSAVIAYTYYITYLLASYGICAVLFGLKIRGEYLFMVHEFDGVASRKPYIAALLVVFLFSLMGFPPLLGFLGSFSLFNDLVMHNHFYMAIYLLAMMLVISYPYLMIIRAVYFEESKDVFDRTDRGIYIAVFLNVLIMITIILEPSYLIDTLQFLLGDLFI